MSEQMGIDGHGLSLEERRIIKLLLDEGRPMGLEAIAATLGLDYEVTKVIHEPYLVAQGFVARTAHGREATSKAVIASAGPVVAGAPVLAPGEPGSAGIPILPWKVKGISPDLLN